MFKQFVFWYPEVNAWNCNVFFVRSGGFARRVDDVRKVYIRILNFAPFITTFERSFSTYLIIHVGHLICHAAREVRDQPASLPDIVLFACTPGESFVALRAIYNNWRSWCTRWPIDSECGICRTQFDGPAIDGDYMDAFGAWGYTVGHNTCELGGFLQGRERMSELGRRKD